MSEIWQKIPNYEGYQVSSFGNVKSFLTNKRDGRILTSWIDKDGYATVWTKHHNKKERVHRLVAMTFIENPLEKPVVNHMNGIKDDNRLENLEWATVAENTQHSYDNGFQVSPASIAVKVLHNDEVISIFSSYTSLAEHMGINRITISKCVAKNENVLDSLSLKEISGNFEKHKLYEKPFVFRHLKRHSAKPVIHGDRYYGSLGELAEYESVSLSTLQYRLKNRQHINGFVPKRITRYEYVNHK